MRECDVKALVRVGQPVRIVPTGIFGALEREMRIGDDSQAQHAHARESRAVRQAAAIRLSKSSARSSNAPRQSPMNVGPCMSANAEMSSWARLRTVAPLDGANDEARKMSSASPAGPVMSSVLAGA